MWFHPQEGQIPQLHCWSNVPIPGPTSPLLRSNRDIDTSPAMAQNRHHLPEGTPPLNTGSHIYQPRGWGNPHTGLRAVGAASLPVPGVVPTCPRVLTSPLGAPASGRRGSYSPSPPDFYFSTRVIKPPLTFIPCRELNHLQHLWTVWTRRFRNLGQSGEAGRQGGSMAQEGGRERGGERGSGGREGGSVAQQGGRKHGVRREEGRGRGVRAVAGRAARTFGQRTVMEAAWVLPLEGMGRGDPGGRQRPLGPSLTQGRRRVCPAFRALTALHPRVRECGVGGRRCSPLASGRCRFRNCPFSPWIPHSGVNFIGSTYYVLGLFGGGPR